MRKHVIYLCGSISRDKRTLQWRRDFEHAVEQRGLRELNDIEIVNPADTAFNRAIENREVSAAKYMRSMSLRSQNIFRAKDYKLVESSTLLVVNLAVIDLEKPPIGTIQELVWARDIFHTPVIGIIGDGNNVYCEHPWMQECLSATVRDVAVAVDFIEEFIF